MEVSIASLNLSFILLHNEIGMEKPNSELQEVSILRSCCITLRSRQSDHSESARLSIFSSILISIPYTSIRAFQCETAGNWDADSELDIYTGNFWDMKKVSMDFHKGKVDILAVHRFMSAVLMGDSEEQARYFDHSGAKIEVKSRAGVGGFVAWLGGDSIEQDTTVTDATLHSDPPILMAE